MHCGYILVQCTFCGYILVAYLVVIGNKLLSVHFVVIFLYTASKSLYIVVISLFIVIIR